MLTPPDPIKRSPDISETGIGIDTMMYEHAHKIYARFYGSLKRAAQRAKLILIVRACLLMSAMLIGTITIISLIDYSIGLQRELRIFTLLGILYLLVYSARRLLIPALRFSITPTQIALSIEQNDPSTRGAYAGIIDLFESTKDKERSEHEDQATSSLRASLLAQAATRFEHLQTPSITRYSSLLIALSVFLIASIVPAITISRSTSLAFTGIERALTPWSSASWPIRYPIDDRTSNEPRAIDTSVMLIATVGSSPDQSMSASKTHVRWRVVQKSTHEQSAWNRLPMIAQNKRDHETGLSIFEQLIDPQQLINLEASDQSEYQIEYQIFSKDDQTQIQVIDLIHPPKLVSTHTSVTPPEYASSLIDTDRILSGDTRWSDSEINLNPIIEGSTLEITWMLDKPIDQQSSPLWMRSLQETGASYSIEHPDRQTVSMTIIANDSFVLSPSFVDRHSVSTRDPISLGAFVLDDELPSASLINPKSDLSVSINAEIEINAELRDDLGLARGTIQANIKPGSDPGSSQDEFTTLPHSNTLSRTIHTQSFNTTQTGFMSTKLQVANLDVQPGDQIMLVAHAWDLQQNPEIPEHAMSQSRPRILTIESESTIIDQIHRSLDPLSNSLKEIDESQRMLMDKLAQNALTSSKDQSEIRSKIQSTQRVIDQLRERFALNKLQDQALNDQLAQINNHLDQAESKAQRAREQIDRDQHERALDAQKDVREQLAHAITAINRGQNAWLAIRSVEQLHDELARVNQQTNELKTEIAGRSIDQLNEQEQSTLEQILERQLGLAADAQSMIDTLQTQSNALKEKDPTQSNALEQAADRARRSQLEDRLRQAGAQIERNQTGAASQSQSEILDELKEILDELESSVNNRDDALRRKLATLKESLKSLISAQERISQIIEESSEENAFDLLDQPTRIHLGNTLVTRDDSIGAFPETKIISDLISSSARSQSTSINSILESPSDLSGALGSSRASTLHLSKALEETERLDQQAQDRQARRARDELLESYKESLEEQVTIRDGSAQLIIDQGDRTSMTRRQRASARSLSMTQSDLKDALNELLEHTEELNDAPVFNLAHTQLDRFMSRSSESLHGKALTPGLINTQNHSITILQSLIEVLDDNSASDEPEDFDDGSSGGGSSSSNPGEEPLIPPVAQLKLLRSIQELAKSQAHQMSTRESIVSEQEINELADLQSMLYEHARTLVEQMSQPQSPPQTPEPTNQDSEPTQESDSADTTRESSP